LEVLCLVVCDRKVCQRGGFAVSEFIIEACT
jgi:hypothetical protein